MADKLLQQGKDVQWLCDDQSGAALVKVVPESAGTSSGGVVPRYDVVSATISYVGYAAPGTATSAAAWQIKRLTTAADGGIDVEVADGNLNFDNVWDNRASLTYS